ncbi:formyltransferase family protein [Snuella sedimenti]|uniref:phosphoribosylglycinamide formyltransferase 1 n=1 Tax=Snuella sedimenti TaxID=2798802 RepID=A0A8J7LMZ1_9FLAO|nr:formyltransferase family protein [Snuella sedimenti]MBJ6368154.1 hypothetical protein [Snuella sedimenti]
MRIAFAASRNLAVEIIRWIDTNKSLYDIELVGGIAPSFKGWWDEQVKHVYEELKIPVYSSIEELIEQTSPDLIFSLNYWKLISSECISKVKKGIINIHHSHLLRFKGRYSTSWAIINARKDNYWKHGTTLHYIDEKLDEGKIIASSSCPIEEKDTAETLFNKVEILAVDLFKEKFKDILNGVESFLEPSEMTYYYDKDSNKNLKLDPESSIEEIYDFVRGWSFKDRPKPYFEYNGQKMYLSLNDV